MRIELIKDADCPNVEAAREQLRSAQMATGISAPWTEWDRAAPDCPAHLRAFGSPTILVDGVDVAPDVVASASCCRLYSDGAQLAKVPSLARLVAALQGAQR